VRSAILASTSASSASMAASFDSIFKFPIFL
jgi:hypothetical protein